MPFEWNNILVVTVDELVPKWYNWKALEKAIQRDKSHQFGIKRVRTGGNGRQMLIAMDSLPQSIKESLKQKSNFFQDQIKSDPKAIEFYSDYLLPDGSNLGAKENGKYLREYSNNAAVLNTLHTLYIKHSEARKKVARRLTGFWQKYSPLVNEIRDDFGHTLPTTPVTLKRSYSQYKKGYSNNAGIFKVGYEALISDKFCNDNSRKVSVDIEKLLMALYTMPNKPFAADVHELYSQFITGEIQVVDKKTGEMFDPSDFKRNGKPLKISPKTVWNYINNPDNRSTVDTKRSGQFQFNNNHRPHHHRKLPNYSFSKISMDDRDLPRKLASGGRVKAYYSYDVLSGCVIGRSYSVTKDEELFLECMRDTFRLIEREKLGMPLEVEVENHLVNKFADDLAFMFTYVRFCNPGNSQEKRAEHFNKAKKYGVEKKAQNAIGRWWAKSEAHRVDVSKVNDEFVEKGFTYERLVADDIAAIAIYNNQLHPRQKRFPGKTRWQVLIENINPETTEPNKAVVYKSIGEKTETTIRRNQYVRVQYANYQLPTPEIMRKLQPNDYTVEAYYLPDVDGVINEVYLYQNSNFICRCEKIVEYNEAKAEWTNIDQATYTKQAHYVSKFDSRKKKAKSNLYALAIEKAVNIPSEISKISVVQNDQEESIEDILRSYNADDERLKSINNI